MFPVEQIIYSTADEAKQQKGSIGLFLYPKNIYEISKSEPFFLELRSILNVVPDEDEETIFYVETGNRNYKLQAETTHDMLDWIQIITAATRDAVCQAEPVEKMQLREANRKSRRAETDVKFKKDMFKSMRVMKQGWLQKKGILVRAWRWRYFVLQMENVGHPQLKYYLCPDTTVSRGSIGK